MHRRITFQPIRDCERGPAPLITRSLWIWLFSCLYNVRSTGELDCITFLVWGWLHQVFCASETFLITSAACLCQPSSSRSQNSFHLYWGPYILWAFAWAHPPLSQSCVASTGNIPCALPAPWLFQLEQLRPFLYWFVPFGWCSSAERSSKGASSARYLALVSSARTCPPCRWNFSSENSRPFSESGVTG